MNKKCNCRQLIKERISLLKKIQMDLVNNEGMTPEDIKREINSINICIRELAILKRKIEGK